MSIEARYSASFVTFGKPCEEALADLSTAYNALADKIEAEWEKSARLEARIEEEQQLRHEAQTRYALAEARCERLEGALREINYAPVRADRLPSAELYDVKEIARAALAEEPQMHPTDLAMLKKQLNEQALAEEPHADVPTA